MRPELQRALARALANFKGTEEEKQRIHSHVERKIEKKRKLTSTLLQRDGSCCFYCGLHLGADISIEHLHEKSRGGSDHPNNLKLAHVLCNNDVQGLTVEEKLERAFFKG